MTQDNLIHYKKDELPLKIGIIMPDSDYVDKWQKDCLEKLLSYPDISVVVILKLHCESAHNNFRHDNLLKGWRHTLFRLYNRYIRRISKSAYYKPPGAINTIPVISMATKGQGKHQHILDDSALSEIETHHLDVILSLADNELAGPITAIPRFGVWAFRFSDATKYSSNPPCFWELYNGDSLTLAGLYRLTENPDKAIVLRKGHFRTITYSYQQNLAQCYSICSLWPLQVCNDIINNVTGYLYTPATSMLYQYNKFPGNIQMTIYIVRLLRNILFNVLHYLFRHEQWNIALCDKSIDNFLNADFKPVIKWSPFISKKRYMADPFGLEENKAITILCEEYDYHSGRGGISSISTINGEFQSLQQHVIRMPFHMSYPGLIKDKGEIYCIPESSENREISLYKCIEFPLKWEKVCILISNVAAVDSTVFHYDSLWWLFYTDNDIGDGLHLFINYAENLRGPWKPHANNPVKTDIRSTRPAGTPFVVNGNLYRPAQDCLLTYGGRIAINRIVRLSPFEFEEECVQNIEPDPDSPFNCGLHTISDVGIYTLIDGKRLIFSPDEFKHNIKRLLARIQSKRDNNERQKG